MVTAPYQIMQLKRKNLINRELRKEEIDVPEFGEGVTTFVKEINVADKGLIAHDSQQYETNAASVIAALCAINDKEELVFGVNKKSAVQFVSELPEEYSPAIIRIASKALELSARVSPNGVEMTDAEMVDSAEKN